MGRDLEGFWEAEGGALRDLPPDTRRSSYAFKASLSIALVATR